MKIPFFSRNQDPSQQEDDILKTVNTLFFDQAESSSTSESARLSIEEEEEKLYDNIYVGGEENSSTDMMIIGGLNSERLFYEPHGTRSLLKVIREPKVVPPRDGLPFEEESVVLAMESADPYRDFRKSMEEMMEIHGLKDWESWEELLGWYLRMNGKINHGFIVGAFIDLLVRMSPPCSDSDSSSAPSPVTRDRKKNKMIIQCVNPNV